VTGVQTCALPISAIPKCDRAKDGLCDSHRKVKNISDLHKIISK
jgi:hypothetical protein